MDAFHFIIALKDIHSSYIHCEDWPVIRERTVFTRVHVSSKWNTRYLQQVKVIQTNM